MSNEPKWTPVPWLIASMADDDDVDFFLRRCTLIYSETAKRQFAAGDVAYVASIREDNRTTPEQDANARLICAALDLYEALSDLLDAIEGKRVTVGDCNAARAALAKARGEA